MVSYVLACLYLQFSIARKQRHPLLTFLLLFHQFVNELLCAQLSIRVVRRWLTLCERAVWCGNVAFNQLLVSQFVSFLAFQFFNFDRLVCRIAFLLDAGSSFSCGEYRSRTDDLLLAKQAL